MKKNIITLLIIFVIPFVAYFGLSKHTESVSAKNTTSSQQMANVKGKPQVIKFTSAMCRDCQTMNGIFKQIFPKYTDKIALIEIHVQDRNSFNSAQMKKYNVELVPTIILIDSKGKIVDRIEGAIPQAQMDKKLQDLK